MTNSQILKFVSLFFLAITNAFCQEIKQGVQALEGANIYFEYRFHPNGDTLPTLVLEAGALSHSSYWDPVIDSLSRSANVLRYDRSGLGNSQFPLDSQRTVDKVSNELFQLMKALEINQKVILICHSAGGFYGQYFAYQHPECLNALVLIETPCNTWENQLRSKLSPQQNQSRDSVRAANLSRYSMMQRQEYLSAEKNRALLSTIDQIPIPIVVIYGTNHNWPADYPAEQLEREWKNCQQSFARLSLEVSHIPIPGGHHLFSSFDLEKWLKSFYWTVDRK